MPAEETTVVGLPVAAALRLLAEALSVVKVFTHFGFQSGSDSLMVLVLVTLVNAVPSAWMRKRSPFPKAIHWLSGDQVGWVLFVTPLTSSRVPVIWATK